MKKQTFKPFRRVLCLLVEEHLTDNHLVKNYLDNRHLVKSNLAVRDFVEYHFG